MIVDHNIIKIYGKKRNQDLKIASQESIYCTYPV